jgi:hypothetical protein
MCLIEIPVAICWTGIYIQKCHGKYIIYLLGAQSLFQQNPGRLDAILNQTAEHFDTTIYNKYLIEK